MEDGRHFENKKWRYLRIRLSDLHEISYADAK